MRDTVAQIKDRLSIEDVVSSYIKIETVGNRMKARCPFHNEKTPSFYLSPERNTYHCFGCGKGGDIFSFIEEIEGVDFKEALKMLAERAGVQIVYSGSSDESKKTFKIIESAKQFFVSNINDTVIAYLKDRGITEETIQNFAIGFAKDDWRELTTHLRSLGYSDKEILLAGLAVESSKGIYDRFRGRIMFPINDSQGRTIAFTGRIFPSLLLNNKSVGKNPAKYVNSPETELFHKSDILFGYDIAKNTIRNQKRVIIVEGQMDVILAHQAGFTETIGVSGTALTDNHIKLIKRFTDNIVFCFDGDNAGFSASEKSIKKALSLACNVKVVFLENEKDPADMVREDRGAFIKMINESLPFIDALLSRAQKSHKDIHSQRSYVAKYVIPYVKILPQVMEKAHYINIIARALDLTDSDIAKVLDQSEDIKFDLDTIDNINKKSSIDREKILAGYLFLNEEKSFVSSEIVDGWLKEFLGTDKIEFCSLFENEKEILISDVEFQTKDDLLPKALLEAILLIAEERLILQRELLSQSLRLNESDEKLLQEYNQVIQTLDLVKRHRHEV